MCEDFHCAPTVGRLQDPADIAQIREARLLARAARAWDTDAQSEEFEHDPALEYWKDVFLFGEDHAVAAYAARREDQDAE